jgi:hypothetical protein
MPVPVRGPARLPLRCNSREEGNGNQVYTFVKKASLSSIAEAGASSVLDKRGSERADSVLIGEPNGKGGLQMLCPPFFWCTEQDLNAPCGLEGVNYPFIWW